MDCCGSVFYASNNLNLKSYSFCMQSFINLWTACCMMQLIFCLILWVHSKERHKTRIHSQGLQRQKMLLNHRRSSYFPTYQMHASNTNSMTTTPRMVVMVGIMVMCNMVLMVSAGAGMRSYRAHDPVPVLVNNVGPFNNPAEVYPVCYLILSYLLMSYLMISPTISLSLSLSQYLVLVRHIHLFAVLVVLLYSTMICLFVSPNAKVIMVSGVISLHG
jgi:hypothetical protein